MTSPTPLVSVLTPSFNQAAWLPDNLGSVARQTYPAIEHIVMDGGSTDGTVELLKAAGDTVRWESEPDRGQAHAINKAFAASSGEIIGWINSDDAYFAVDTIAEVVAFFLAHPDIDVVYGHCLQTTADGGAIQVLGAPVFDRELLLTVNCISQPATFIRRSALSEPMLDESFHFALDYELWLRLLTTGHGFARIDAITAIDRHQPERKSSTIKASDLKRLAEMYPTQLGPEFERIRTAWYRGQRYLGARVIGSVRPDRVAFSAPADMRSGLWRRQLFSRKSHWPAEYR